MNNPTALKVIHDWGQLNKGKGSLKRPREESIIPYAQWMREIMHIIKLPFARDSLVKPRAHVPIMTSMEEGDTLSATILRLSREKEELEEKVSELPVWKIS